MSPAGTSGAGTSGAGTSGAGTDSTDIITPHAQQQHRVCPRLLQGQTQQTDSIPHAQQQHRVCSHLVQGQTRQTDIITPHTQQQHRVWSRLLQGQTQQADSIPHTQQQHRVCSRLLHDLTAPEATAAVGEAVLYCDCLPLFVTYSSCYCCLLVLKSNQEATRFRLFTLHQASSVPLVNRAQLPLTCFQDHLRRRTQLFIRHSRCCRCCCRTACVLPGVVPTPHGAHAPQREARQR
jgi:hypothetical protein